MHSKEHMKRETEPQIREEKQAKERSVGSRNKAEADRAHREDVKHANYNGGHHVA